jgi:prepilin-type processing-associated H-X9-DG protein
MWRAEVDAPETYRTDERFVFSYGVLYLGVNDNPGKRKSPWTTIRGWPGTGVQGPVIKTKITHASEVHLVWDAYIPHLVSGGNYQQLKPSLSNTVTGWLNPEGVHIGNVFRHSVRGDYKRGPNALFADGHCEPRVNIFDLTDYETTLPGQ